MDKREMEKLMDKYKAELLEFSKRNNVSGYPQVEGEDTDKRAEAMNNAVENNEPFERDRSDPLAETAAETVADTDAQAIPVQAPIINVAPAASEDVTDAAEVLRRGCAALNAGSTPEQRTRCREINEFLAQNPESGTLKVEAFASDRAFGVGSARVMMFLELPSGNVAVYDGITDIDGVSGTVRLPAPPRSLSQAPETGENPPRPYSVYSVYVEHPAYVRAVFTNVPVFSGTESIQPVRMLAKAAGLQEPEPIVVDESMTNTLR